MEEDPRICARTVSRTDKEPRTESLEACGCWRKCISAPPGQSRKTKGSGGRGQQAHRSKAGSTDSPSPKEEAKANFHPKTSASHCSSLCVTLGDDPRPFQTSQIRRCPDCVDSFFAFLIGRSTRCSRVSAAGRLDRDGQGWFWCGYRSSSGSLSAFRTHRPLRCASSLGCTILYFLVTSQTRSGIHCFLMHTSYLYFRPM